MKTTVNRPTEIEIAAVRISFELMYDDDDCMPKDFPLRKGGIWTATVDMDTGAIREWPKDKPGAFDVFEKVVDCGTYTLLAPDGSTIAEIAQNYVPNDVVPGEYGDYVDLKIRDGVITNWPRKPDVSSFFSE